MKNNNEKFENFIRDFDTIRMTHKEKKDIENNLVLFTTSYIPKPSPYFSYISFFKKTIAITLVLLLIVSVSKTASAKSLPGELLYNVKIIHEEIESAIINQPEKKVIFEIERTKTRIQEAVTLARDNKLDKVKQKKIAENIRKHVKNVSDSINSIKKKDPEKALALNSNLKTTLKVNSKALEKAVNETKKESTIKKEDATQKQGNNDIKIEEQKSDTMTIDSEKILDKKNNNNTEEEIIDKENTITTNEKAIINGNTVEDITADESQPSKSRIGSDKNDLLSSSIILSSISEDIAKTEDVSDEIENEIIFEESNELKKNIQDDIKKAVDIIDEQSIKEKQDKKNHIIANDTKHEEDLLNSEENIIQNEQIGEKSNTSKNVEISDNIRSEIVSLKHVLEAEQRLKLLLEDTSKDRDKNEIKIIKSLMEEKRFGQAYVEIQKEIETLTEEKLLKELGMIEEPEAKKIDDNSGSDILQINTEKTQE